MVQNFIGMVMINISKLSIYEFILFYLLLLQYVRIKIERVEFIVLMVFVNCLFVGNYVCLIF